MAKESRRGNLLLLSDEEVEERRPILLAGIGQFNDGYFFEAHETLEELWLQCRPPVRTFLQGIIQVAAAYVHLMRHEYPGTIRLLDAALLKFADCSDGYMGVDLARLVTETQRARDELAGLGPERFEEWDRGRIPQIHLVGAASLAERRR